MSVNTASKSTLYTYAKANDASHYSLTPAAIKEITSLEEMSLFFRSLAGSAKHITFRSGGTSLSGQGVTNGILVDTRRGFREVSIKENGALITCQPGVTVREINARLKPYGYKLGPDPASEIAATIGGVLANNSSGMVCGTTENAYQTIVSMKIVFADGSILDTASPSALQDFASIQPELCAAIKALKDEVAASTHLKTSIANQFRIKNTMGYSVNAFVDFDNPIDILNHLMIGSEGTLGFIAEATLRTIPLKSKLSTDLYLFNSLHEANSSLEAIITQGPAAVELLDATSLRVSQRSAKTLPAIAQLDIDHQAALIVEYQELSEEALVLSVENAHKEIALHTRVNPMLSTRELSPRTDLWHLRKGLYTAVAGSRPTGTTALLEDVAVPVAKLASTCEELHRLFSKYSYKDSVIFGHAKDGNIHFMLSEDFTDTAAINRYEKFTEEMADLVLGNSGTLKAEHGTGRVMAPFVERQFGSEIYQVMVRLKKAFDPQNILNPDVIITTNSRVHLENFKHFTPVANQEINKCVECGFCENTCPSKFLTLTPRQRIVAERVIATSSSKVAATLMKEIPYLVDSTCAADGMCQLACPLEINTGNFVKEIRSNESKLASQIFWRIAARNWSSFLSLARTGLKVYNVAPAIFNPLMSLIHKLFGTPILGKKRFAVGKKRQSLKVQSPDLIYLPSCINELFGESEDPFLELCRKAGIRVHIPENISNICCATPWSSKGKSSGEIIINEIARASLGISAIPVVVDNGSCLEGFAKTFTNLKVVSATEYILENVLAKLAITQLDSVVLHPTCSTEKADSSKSLNRVCSALAKEVITPPNWGCCAFAGDRGFLEPELTKSATHEEAIFVQSVSASAYVSNSSTCELAMTQASGKKYESVLAVLNRQAQ